MKNFCLKCIAFMLCGIAILDQAQANQKIVTTLTELNSALSSAHAGDTIIMKNGTWKNTSFTISTSGDSLKPIVVRAQARGSVILTGTSAVTFSGSYIIVDGLRFEGATTQSNTPVTFNESSSHCRITQTAIVNFNATTGTNQFWVNIWGKFNRVDHCYFNQKRFNGQTLRVRRDIRLHDTITLDYHRVDHNYFGDFPSSALNGGSDGESIQIGLKETQFTSSSSTIEYNYFYKCDADVEVISVKSGGNMLRHNTFVNCQGTISLRHGSGSTVEGNYFFVNQFDGGGIRIYGVNHKVINNYVYGTVNSSSSQRGGICIQSGDNTNSRVDLANGVAAGNSVVAFNTLVNCRNSIILGSEKVVPPHDITVANNVIYTTLAPALFLYSSTSNIVNPTYEGNIFYGTSLGITPQPSGITVKNPNLASEIIDGQKFYRLTDSSAAINAAVGDYPYVTEDIEGQVRSGIKDIGADEYGKGPNKPVTPSDVGPEFKGGPALNEVVDVPGNLAFNVTAKA
jgi:poly(beta-D-mannuronate) lyase